MASTTRVPRLVFLAVALLLTASSCLSQTTPERDPVTTTVVEAKEADVAVADQEEPDVPPTVGGFSWTEVLTVPDGFVGSVTATDHGYYAVSQNHDDGFYAPTRVWHSTDGTQWSEMDVGAFGPGASLSALVSGGSGVVAAGFMPDGDSHVATVWTSADGSLWKAQSLGYTVPGPTAEFQVSILNLDALAAGPDHGLTAGVEHQALDWPAARAAVMAALPPGVADLPEDHIATNPESVTVRVGPFAVFTSNFEELGIDSAVADAFADTGGPSSEELLVFGSPDLEEWTTIEAATLTTSTVAFISGLLWSGSTYVASVWGYGPGNLLVSDDGTTWEEAALPPGVEDLAGMYLQGDRLLGDAWAGGARVLLTSSDGREWSTLGPVPGTVGMLGAGPLGIMAEGWGEDGGWCNPESMEPTVVDNSEGTLTASRSTLSITDRSGEVIMEEQLRIADPTWGEELALPEGTVVDYEAETVTFVSGDADLMYVTFDELESAYREACASSRGCCPIPTTEAGSVLYFSQDGLEWMSQDVAETPIVGSVTGISVGTAQVIVTTIDESDGDMTSRLWLGTPTAEDAAAAEVSATVELPATVEVGEVAMDGASPAGDVVFSLPSGIVPRSLATSTVGSVVIAAPEAARMAGPSRAWASPDGDEWVELGPEAFGTGASIDVVVAGGPGFMAVGTLPEDDGAQAMAWTSVDGVTWAIAPLGLVLEPTDVPHTQSSIHYASVVAGPGGALVMADQSTGFAWDLLEPAVAEALPAGLQDTDRMMIDPDRVLVQWGPFVVFSERVQDLAVDQELFDAYAQSVTGDNERNSLAFTTDDFVTWTAKEVEEAYWSVAPSRDGYVATSWSHGPSCTMRQSPDGFAWSDAPCPAGALEVFHLAGGSDVLYATGTTTSGNALWVSEDGGVAWEMVGGVPGNMYELSVGDAGMASVGEPGTSEEAWLPPEMRDPVTIEVDGYTMIVGPGEDGFEVLDSEGRVVVSETLSVASPHGEGYDLPASMTIDAANQTLTVIDESGDEQFTITVDQLEDAVCGLPGMCMFAPPPSVLWFSRDGLHWSEDPVANLVGYEGFAWRQLIAVSDRILMAPRPASNDEAVAIWRATPSS